MNIEAYNLDSLRKLVRSLQDENRRLKEQLEKANIAYASQNIFEEKTETIEEYDPDQGERILYQYITEDMVNKPELFTALCFWHLTHDRRFKFVRCISFRWKTA